MYHITLVFHRIMLKPVDIVYTLFAILQQLVNSQGKSVFSIKKLRFIRLKQIYLDRNFDEKSLQHYLCTFKYRCKFCDFQKNI